MQQQQNGAKHFLFVVKGIHFKEFYLIGQTPIFEVKGGFCGSVFLGF